MDGTLVGALDGTKVGCGFLLGGTVDWIVVGNILGAKVCVSTSLIEQHASTSSSAVTRILPTY